MTDVIVTATAPGKVVLCGEYAVLEGAPAVCMAVGVRARVTIEATSASHHRVVAPGHSDRAVRFRDAGGEIEWLDDGGPFELLRHTWRRSRPRVSSSLAISLDTSAFIDAASDAKIGLGSSAALAVALAAAVDAMQPGGDPLDVAHEAHLDLQDGRGSGIDVACSAAGGLILYEIDGRRSSRLQWPQGLAYRLLFSGVAAPTAAKIERFEQNAKQGSRSEFHAAAVRMSDAWRQGSAVAVLGACRDYIGALEKFSVDHALGIFDAGHAELAAAAHAHGLVYKPCGAGGGDVGIAFASDAGAIEDFIAGGLPAGFRALDVGIDLSGVEIAGGTK